MKLRLHRWSMGIIAANKGGHCRVEKVLDGDVRESNPGPLAPKARIIPLDQHPLSWWKEAGNSVYIIKALFLRLDS